MSARSGRPEPTRVIDADLAALEVQLLRLADEFVERSQLEGPDAIDLFDGGTALQRAAFVLRRARSTEEIDLRYQD